MTELYIEKGDGPSLDSRKKYFIYAGAAIALTAIVLTILLLYLHLRAPSINLSPPPGWSEASKDDISERNNSGEENKSGAELVTYYINNENDYIRILVTKRGAETDDFPETENPDEIQRYIENIEEYAYEEQSEMNVYELRRYIEDMSPMPLGCGLVGLYQATNPEDSMSYEVLSVRKKNTVFIILYIKALEGQVPSPEIQYIAETLSFD